MKRMKKKGEKEIKKRNTDAVAAERKPYSAGRVPVAFRYVIRAWRKISGD